ncbi:MAG: phosphotransferase family protein [Methyloligellaceae bacterium]
MTADANTLDMAALAPALEKDVLGFSGLNEITKFNTGQSNPTYLLTADSGKYVLRAKPPGKLLKSAHQVDREFRVMNALKETDVPVPETLFLSEEDSAIGRMFYVMKFLDGRILKDFTLPEVPKEDRVKYYDAMNDVLARMHSLDVNAIGLGDYGRPGNYYARQLSTWTKQYRASETGLVQPMEDLITWLNAELPDDDGTVTLVHGDYRLDNVMFHKERPEVIGVLDWELSTLGHPLADLAYQCMYWRLPHDSLFAGLGGLDRTELGMPFEKDYVEAYCKRRGIEGVDHWTFCLAFAVFRFNSIIQGVYKRSLDGNASNPERAKMLGAAVPVLAEIALDMIRSES